MHLIWFMQAQKRTFVTGSSAAVPMGRHKPNTRRFGICNGQTRRRHCEHTTKWRRHSSSSAIDTVVSQMLHEDRFERLNEPVAFEHRMQHCGRSKSPAAESPNLPQLRSMRSALRRSELPQNRWLS
jgi:hypothetical protein